MNLKDPLRHDAIPADLSESTMVRGNAFARLDGCVTQGMANWNIPGAALAVIDQGRLVYERGYGLKHRQLRGLVDANTRFRFGSILKMMTAAAVMQQVEQGKVELETAVTQYIPEFEVSGFPTADEITVWHLLTHSSTFPDRYDPEFLSWVGPTTETTLSDWAATQSDIPLHAIPGAFWNYSNPNFSLAGLVVERTSGVAYHRYMQENGFTPAGMTATTLLPAEVMASGNYSYGPYFDALGSGREVIAAPDAYDNWYVAPAGLGFTRARDLVQFALLLMNEGGQVLTPKSAEELQAPQIDLQVGVPVFYGYGILNYPEVGGVNLLLHTGGTAGWTSALFWVPEQKWAVAVLYNGIGDPAQAAGCVAITMLAFTDETFPDTSRDLAECDRYVGTYQGRY